MTKFIFILLCKLLIYLQINFYHSVKIYAKT